MEEEAKGDDARSTPEVCAEWPRDPGEDHAQEGQTSHVEGRVATRDWSSESRTDTQGSQNETQSPDTVGLIRSVRGRRDSAKQLEQRQRPHCKPNHVENEKDGRA